MSSHSSSSNLPIVLGVTGASGAVYAARLLEWLLVEGRQVHLVVSPDGLTVIQQELKFSGPLSLETIPDFLGAAYRLVDVRRPSPALDADSSDNMANSKDRLRVVGGDHAQDPTEGIAVSAERDFPSLNKVQAALEAGRLLIHQSNDYFVPVASGSYRTAAMIVCPCSGTTMAAIAHANGRNLIHRAAEVHLKERRKLILVPRETPLSTMQIENMLRVSQAGAVVLPAAPGWYHGVKGLGDLVDFVAGRILDQLDIPHERVQRWS